MRRVRERHNDGGRGKAVAYVVLDHNARPRTPLLMALHRFEVDQDDGSPRRLAAAHHPIYVLVKKGDSGTAKDSYALCDQIRVVDQHRFGKVSATLSSEAMEAIDLALTISLGLR